MDKRMIDAHDPTSFGSDIINVVEEHQPAEEEEPNQEEASTQADVEQAGSDQDIKKKKKRQAGDVTIIVEDREWGDLGHGKPVLL